MTFLLPKEGLCTEKEMYFRDKTGNIGWDETRLSVPPKGRVSFDTYFNSFDYDTFRRYTTVENITVTLHLAGQFHISLVDCSRNNDATVTKRTIYEGDFSSETKKDVGIGVALSALSERGILYVKLSTEAGGSYYGGHIDAALPPTHQKVKIGIVITTFKRESYVRQNVAQLIRDLPQENFGIFVIDNGQTLTPDDVKGATLIPNRNLGGSGGFTRGIMEVIRRNNEYTHVLLTDDDIRFRSDIFLRTLAIFKYAANSDKIIVGSSMLYLNRRYLQHELGANWMGYYVEPHNQKIDMREVTSLLDNVNVKKADYSGWWYNAFSLAIPYRVGLPFPFFIKVDDIEYCIRSGCEFVLTNGIGVWHEAFENKYAAELEYYSKRNKIILNALDYPEYGRLYHFRKLFLSVSKQLVYQRYFAVDLIFKAYNDYLRGASYFEKIDADKLHAELRAVGEKQHTIEELEQMGYDITKHKMFDADEKKRKVSFEQVITLNGHLLPNWTYNRNERLTFRLVDMTEPHPKSFFRAYRVVQYNPETKMAFVTKQNRGKVIQTGFRLIGMFFKILFRFGAARRSFAKNLQKLTSFESWEKRFRGTETNE